MRNIFFLMNKTVLCLLFVAGFLNVAMVNGQWNLEKCPTKNNLNAVCFANNYSGWIAGDKGTLLFRSGSGWRIFDTPTEENLYDLAIIDKNDCWAVGAKGTIIHFDGQNWETVDSPTNKDLFSVSFKDSKNGMAVGALGTILIYTDGTWKMSDNEIRGNLYTVIFEKDNSWIGGGLECVSVPIMQLTNTKGQLSVNSYKSYSYINSLTFSGPENGWAVGSPSTLLHYNGKTWEKPSTDNKFSSLKSISFLDENNGVSVGYGGTILVFKNNKWISETAPTNQNLNGVTVSDNNYYVVGNNGTIITKDLKTNTNSPVKIREASREIQVYPNPCDEILNIIIPFENENTPVWITISNTDGQIVLKKQLMDVSKEINNTIVTKSLKNGLYLLQTRIGKNNQKHSCQGIFIKT